MNPRRLSRIVALAIAAVPVTWTAAPVWAESTGTFVVATYNLQNWLSMPRRSKDDRPKPAAQREIVGHVLESIRADVLAVEEIGTRDDLAELAGELRQRGLDYPHTEWIEGADPTRHIALLSRFPITERRSRTNDLYRIQGRTFRLQRGIIDVLIRVNPRYQFRVVAAHLKSKRPAEQGDETAMRDEEAKLLHQHIARLLRGQPHLNLLALGDFNDLPDSEPVRTVIGEGLTRLFDLEPADRRGRKGTHYWYANHKFERIDYLLASPGMSNEFVAGSAHLADLPNWLHGSDHQAVYAQFYDHDRDPEPPPNDPQR